MLLAGGGYFALLPPFPVRGQRDQIDLAHRPFGAGRKERERCRQSCPTGHEAQPTTGTTYPKIFLPQCQAPSSELVPGFKNLES